MINLFDAFAEFVSTHPGITEAERRNIAHCLKDLLDADPEKEMMRCALEHYANEFNWPYVLTNDEGYEVFGMAAEEATCLARNALNSSQIALMACLLSMYEDHTELETVAELQLIMKRQVA
jgi:phage portal protein BeeE